MKDFTLTPEEYEQLNSQQPAGMPYGYIFYEDNIYLVKLLDKNPGYKAYYICAGIYVIAHIRDEFSDNWGMLVRFKNRAGEVQEMILRYEELVSDIRSGAVLSLAKKGLHISIGENRSLLTYLSEFDCDDRNLLLEVSQTGWYKKCFILSNEIIGTHSDKIYFGQRKGGNVYDSVGTLGDWQTNVAKYATDNPFIAFAISCAFAAPLMGLVDMEGGGFHFYGQTTRGKTTLLKIASSVCGGANYMHTWRATDNGMEGVAANHNDTLLVLDELGQVDPHKVGDVAYMLANGLGRIRANKTGGARKAKQWRTLFISSGEISLETHMQMARKTTLGGQDVRFLNIPIPSEGFGIFDNLCGFNSAAEFAEHLLRQVKQYHGTAFKEFLGQIVQNTDSIQDEFKKYLADFRNQCLPDNCNDGVVNRALKRFALVAFAGIKATKLGITGWTPRCAEKAVYKMLNAWYKDRQTPLEKLKSQVRRFIEKDRDVEIGKYFTTGRRPEYNRYWVGDERFAEMVSGFDVKWAAKELVAAKWIEPDRDHIKRKSPLTFRDEGHRMYCFSIVAVFSDE